MKNICLFRQELNLKQEHIANEVGISEFYYRDIEKGRKDPSRKIKEKLEKFFGLPEGVLFQERNHIIEILKECVK